MRLPAHTAGRPSNRTRRRLFIARGVVALHKALVDAEVVQVDKDAIQKHHPERGLRQIQPETAQTKFPFIRGQCRASPGPWG